MSDFLPPYETGPRAQVQPLTSLKPDGTLYVRSATVQTEISWILCLPQSHCIAKVPDLHNETLVYLIRKSTRSEEELWSRLFEELSKRIVRMARRCVRGLDRSIAEDIVMKVEIAVLELVVKEDHSPNSDFLEVSLVQAVQRRTLDAIRNYKRSPMGRRGTVPAAVAIDDNDEDGDEIERPIEFVADGRPGPQDILLHFEDGNLRHQLLRIACDAVKDPRHLEAVILHYAHGWPVTSKDLTKFTLVHYFQETDVQIWNWISAAMKVMRKALMIGVEK